MTRLRLAILTGALVLALAATGTVWGGWFQDSNGDDLADRCHGTLAVDEARELFDGARLKARCHTGEWVGGRGPARHGRVEPQV